MSYPTLHYKEIYVPSKITVLLSEMLSQILDLGKNFVTAYRLPKKCCQFSMTDDCRQFITLSIYLCVQQGRQHAACGTVLSVAAETC